MSFIDSKNLPLSIEFKVLITDFVLEVINVQPAYVYEFALAYFKELLDNRLPNPIPTQVSEINSLWHFDSSSVDNIENIEYRRTRSSRRPGVASESWIPEDFVTTISTLGKASEKNSFQKDILKALISGVVLLKNLSEEKIDEIIFRMVKLEVAKNDVIITEGDDEDFLFIIESGIFEVYTTNSEGSLELVKSLENQGSFGELALMYNTNETGTVKARSDGVLWCLDRFTFKRIVVEKAHLQREKSKEFLSKIRILGSLNDVEINKIADVIEMKTYEKDAVIFRQGDIGDYVYLIESGKVAVIVESENISKEIKILEGGSYFGELSLMTNRPRAATVKTLERTTVGKLDRDGFHRLLGPCLDVLQRNILNYTSVMEQYFSL